VALLRKATLPQAGSPSGGGMALVNLAES